MADVAYLPVGKREQTKVQNRLAILDAAREVFGELGYEAATVRDIIRRTGLAAGTFYNYYRSKEEVFAALADDGARRFGPILKTIRAASPDFGSFVRQAMLAYFEYRASEHMRWLAGQPDNRAGLRVQGETPEMIAVFNEVRDAIEAAITAGKGPAADTEYIAAACIAIAREIGGKMIRRQPVDTAAAADFAAAMIMGGLRGLPQVKR